MASSKNFQPKGFVLGEDVMVPVREIMMVHPVEPLTHGGEGYSILIRYNGDNEENAKPCLQYFRVGKKGLYATLPNARAAAKRAYNRLLDEIWACAYRASSMKDGSAGKFFHLGYVTTPSGVAIPIHAIRSVTAPNILLDDSRREYRAIFTFRVGEQHLLHENVYYRGENDTDLRAARLAAVAFYKEVLKEYEYYATLT